MSCKTICAVLALISAIFGLATIAFLSSSSVSSVGLRALLQDTLASAANNTACDKKDAEQVRRLRAQRGQMSFELNRVQENYHKLRCEMRKQHDTSDTGGWCASAVKSNHVTDVVLADALSKFFAGKTVIGLGDGRGEYRKHLLKIGAVKQYDAYDGSPNISAITNGSVNFLDLTLPQYWLEPHDWAISLEVIEHIPAQYENTVLDNIARVAREGIVLSWAVPGQGGFHHVNNQPLTHVDDVMLQRSFERDTKASSMLQKASSVPWLQANTNVYRRMRSTVPEAAGR